jgi:hypothetical protein
MSEIQIGQRWTPKDPHAIRLAYGPVTVMSVNGNEVVVELDPPFEKQLVSLSIETLERMMVPE